MAFEVTMPRLGWSMESGSVAEWHKQEGDYVAAGEILFSVEGDKAVQDVEALDSGILRIPPDAPAPGEQVPVGTVLAYLVPQVELATFTFGSRTPHALAEPQRELTPPQSPPETPIGSLPNNDQQAPISPVARRIAADLGVEWKGLQGSGNRGRITASDVRAAQARPQSVSEKTGADLLSPMAVADTSRPARRITISPFALRIAAEQGIDWTKLKGSGTSGRITARDVQLAVARALTPAVAPTPPADTRLEMSSTRRTIAERMALSARTTAPVTLTTEGDATRLVDLRAALKNAPVSPEQPVPSYGDLLAKIVAQGLIEHPSLNARLEGTEIIQSTSVHMGIAVDTVRGLLVPVLRNAESKGLWQIARESADLIERALAGRISLGELHGGTFTITNLGMFDIDAFTPIINLPQCAILGVGRIVPKQVVIEVDSQHVAIRHMMFLSLTFDHRVVDGAPAARFLQRIKQLVENPYLWLVS